VALEELEELAGRPSFVLLIFDLFFASPSLLCFFVFMLRYVSTFKEGAEIITGNTETALRIGCEGPYEKNGVSKVQLLELLGLLMRQNTVLQELDLRCKPSCQLDINTH